MRKCPVCWSANHRVILDLGHHPLADTFLPASRRLQPEVLYPLLFVKCRNCEHFFSGFPTDPEERYVASEYSYESANSELSVDHFGNLARACASEIEPLTRETSVLDVGSNDGTLLEQFRNCGIENLVGVDPSPVMAKIAEKRRIETQVSFFDQESAPSLIAKNNGSPFHVVVSANVLNHADDPHEFLATVGKVLSEEGIFVFEVPNLIDLVKLRAFETIYHEHVHYWTAQSLRSLLSQHGFNIFRIESVDYMCGSLRVFASMNRPETANLSHMIVGDRESVVRNERELELFARDVQTIKLKTVQHLVSSKLSGRRIVAVGAATKGNTLLNYLGLDTDLIDFVTDTSQEKIGKFTPGSKLPIRSDQALLDLEESTLVLILPWNLDSFLRSKFRALKLEMLTPQISFGRSSSIERSGLYGQAQS